MRHSSLRRPRVTGILLAGACGLALLPGHAALSATPQTVGDSVAEALALAAGSAATVDDSTQTTCMGVDPQPLVYVTNRVVVRTDDPVADVRRTVNRALRHIGSSATAGPIEKITLPQLSGGTPVDPVLSVTLHASSSEPVPVVRLSRHLRFHHGLPASPDYYQSPTSGPTGMWPDGFPEPTDTPTPPRPGKPGAGITITVYDTGLAKPTQTNHPPNVSRLTPGDVEVLDATVPADKIVDLYFGAHQVAIAGVLNVMAPGAAVKAVRITEANGLATDVSAARRMATTLREANQSGVWPDVIVNAFGSPACDLDPGNPGAELEPLGLQAVVDAVELHDKSLIVASAGNRDTSRRFYPAAFPSVLAIGALDATADADLNPWTSLSRTAPRASFSNYGTWVDGWASGVGLPTNHVVGLRFEEEGPVIDGLALVKGTSFSAPVVAALIAEQMAVAGVDADAAWEAIAATGVQCLESNGGGVAVALPSFTATATTKPGAPRSRADC